jgi:hypothetical protein
MKIKFALPLLFLVLFSSAAFSQSVVVTTKKTIYTRRKPLADFKKTFTINYPKIKAANAALSRKIEAALSYEKNFEFTLQEEMGEVQWLEEADYEVVYNKNGILTVNLFITGSGAYPDSSNKTVVVNLKTGNKLKASDVFTNFNGLIAKISEMQQAEIKEGIEEIKKDPDFAGENPQELFTDADFKAGNLEGFSVNDDGVTFSYDYGFAHAIQAVEPNGKYFLDWAQLKPYIKPAGLLARFTR